MEWQHPEWLYPILPLAAAWLALSMYSRRRRQRAAEAFVASPMSPRILPADSSARFWLKTFLREAGLIAGLVALAGPRFGTQYEEVVPRGSDLYVLIDVSRSMLARDVPPTRLERAKADVAALVNRLEGERVGLIAFSGQAVVKCPLTVDYDAFRRSLDELDTHSAPRGGTAIGDAIRKALEVFHARAERDQAILLITDGDDQQSYPLEAAAVAAERHVTIFTVGLGDADQGARVPQGVDSQSYVEYEGQQVWSKLDGTLLKDIALKTSGVYVPVGTRAYDLGELYADYLQGKRGAEGASQKRIRRSDQFQLFLALALLALLADLCVRSSSRAAEPAQMVLSDEEESGRLNGKRARRSVLPATSALVLMGCLSAFALSASARADEAEEAVRDGLRLYASDEFDKARDKFAAAAEDFGSEAAEKAAIAAFDEACASHRKGDFDHARERYLKAGLAHDSRLAAAAHFNLGTLAAEQARQLAGEHPENVAADKRPEILNHLKGAVASLRHSLDLQPENPRARRDIELVRQWIKYYSDKWREHDRQKRREESNLLAFLEFLIETQTALRETVHALPATASADAYAEIKRAQDELREEIPPLKDKLKNDLQAPQASSSSPPGGPAGQPTNSKEMEEGIALLQGWAEAAGEKMASAAAHLSARNVKSAMSDQQSAIDELERIWEAVIPFHPLLARDLADQSLIAASVQPASDEESSSADDSEDEPETTAQPKAPSQRPQSTTTPALGAESEDLAKLAEMEERTLRRTHLLKLKAQAELERLESSPPSEAASSQTELNPGKDEDVGDADEDASNDAGDKGAAPRIDPEQVKAGYRKAIELAPQAAESMEAASKWLKKNDRKSAYPPAEEARKILEEIQQAQPKNDQRDQQNQDQEKKDQDKNDEKNDEQKKDREEPGDDKKDQQQKKPEPQKNDDQKKQSREKQPQVSRDRMEEALRKVRERQQEKRERDRKMKARISGRIPVDKDW